MSKKTKLSSSSSSSTKDLVEEREELLAFPSENIVQTSNTKSKDRERKGTKLSLSSSSSPPAIEDLVEEREDFMAFPSENSRLISKEKTHLLKPCFTTSIDGSEAMLPLPDRLDSSRPDLKALSLSVSLHGWRLPNTKFKSWATKMSVLHKPTWQKAGILQAVMASTNRIHKNTDLLLGIAEKWCPKTRTFVFPWGETTITLEDVTVLLGFPVLGSPVFATLDSSGEKIKAKLEKEWRKIKNEPVSFVTQVAWMRRFSDSGDELEHVAFLVLWLCYFVFPTRYYHIYEAVFPIAVHLSSGTRIALAPAVLAHLYAELSLLKDHIRAFTKLKSIDKIELSALFKLVQVWTWERFRELQPKRNLLLEEGQPRLACWEEVKQRNSDVRQILDSSKIDSFEWRPYTKTVKNWEFPKFYPEKAMWVPVDPNLDDEFISFGKCITVSTLVGIDSVEDYFPNRVASQFGMLQDVPAPVNRNINLSHKAAWTQYNKPMEDLTLFIPSRSAVSRVTPMFCDWWRKSFPQFQYYLKEKGAVESAKTLKPRNIIGHDCVPSSSKIAEYPTNKRRKCMKQVYKRRKYMNRVREDGSKMERTSEDEMKIANDSAKERRQDMKQARDKKTHKYMKPVCENDDEEDDGLTISQIMRLRKKKKYSDVKNNGGDASEPLGKKGRVEVDNNDSTGADGDETVPPPEIEQRNEETDEIRSIFSDPPLGLDVYETNVEKMTVPEDGSKEPECLLHEDGAMGGEMGSSEKKEDDVVDDDSLIQTKLASNEDNSEPTTHQKISSGGSGIPDESNIHQVDDGGTQVHDFLLHDAAVGTEETIKSNEQLEKRNEDVGEGDAGNDSLEKSSQNLKVLVSSMEERIDKALKNVAWLKEMKAIKQRKIAAARLI